MDDTQIDLKVLEDMVDEALAMQEALASTVDLPEHEGELFDGLTVKLQEIQTFINPQPFKTTIRPEKGSIDWIAARFAEIVAKAKENADA